MSSNEPVARLPVTDTYRVAPTVARDADYHDRWTAWVARGHAHEEIVRRKLAVFAGVLAIVAGILYVLLR